MSSEASCYEMCSSVEIKRLWGTVSLSEVFQQEKSKSLIFTSSKMVNVDNVETWYLDNNSISVFYDMVDF